MTEEEKGQGGQGQEPEPRQISEEKLKRILEAHEKWVEEGMDREKPGQADLSGTDLRGKGLSGARLEGSVLREAHLEGADLNEAHLEWADLTGARLEGADLNEARLEGANLRWARLEGAKLYEAHLEGANLTLVNLNEASLFGAKLRGATLHHADLTGVLHLDVRELAGLDLYMTKLHPDIARFDGLNTIEEAAKKAGKLFAALMTACLYAGVTFVTNPAPGGMVKLFLSDKEVSLQVFLLASPFLLLGVFIYFHLYLQRMWEALAGMPAVFPDGAPLDKKAHPWLLAGFVRAHVELLRRGPQPPLTGIQLFLIQVLAWWLAPATLLAFWLFLFQSHDPDYSGWLAGLAVLACLAASHFQDAAGRTLRLEEAKTIGEYLRSHQPPLSPVQKIVHLVGEFHWQVNVIAWVAAFFTFMYSFGR